jgi:hypothetical protein
MTSDDRMAELDAWIATANHKEIKFGLMKMRMARERMLREFQDGIDELAACDKPEPKRTATGRVVRKDAGIAKPRRQVAESAS